MKKKLVTLGLALLLSGSLLVGSFTHQSRADFTPGGCGTASPVPGGISGSGTASPNPGGLLFR